jgi:putative heme-binding domain-containing protein
MRKLVLAVAAVWAAVPASAQDGHVARTDPLSPEEQLRRFRLPAGFRIQLVAAEPDVIKPMNLAFDDQGRLYVTQSVEYPFPAAPGSPGRDVVKRLEDFGPDGRARKVSRVVEGLNIPIGLLPRADALLVHSIPKIWICRDRDGDGRYEEREPLYGEFGYKDTHGMTNAFTPWVDGWIYACHGFANTSIVRGRDGHAITMRSGNTYRLRPDGSRVEAYTHGQVNPFGLCFDPLGNLYSADCHSRPAYLLLRGACYPTFEGTHDGLGLGPALMSHDHGSSAIAGIVYYAASHFPPPYRDTIFLGNVVTHRINHDRLEWKGSGARALEQPDFLTCEDPWFRPVDLKLGPDGALYIADFYNRIIGHYEVPLDHPGRDKTRGRIWRIVYEGPNGGPLRPAPDLSRASRETLFGFLADENLVLRVQATERLVGLGPAIAEPLWARMSADGSSPWLRAHGLWVLERVGALSEERVARLSADPDRAVRVHLARAIGERGGWTFEGEVARRMLRDADPFVRRAAAEALGLHPEEANLDPLLALWEETSDADPFLAHVVKMSVRNHLRDPKLLASASGRGTDSPARARRVSAALLGVRTPESGRALLTLLRAHGTVSDELLHHAARYAPEEDVPSLVALARERAGSVAAVRALHRGFQERGRALGDAERAWAADVLRKALTGSEARAAGEALTLARELRLEALRGDVAAVATDASRAPDLRGAAAEALAAIDPEGSVPSLEGLLKDSAAGLDLRRRAAAALGATGRPGARDALVRALSTAPQGIAAAIAGALAANREGAEALLAAAEQGKASPRLLLEKSVEARFRALKAQDLESRRAKLTASLPPEDERLGALLEARRKGYLRAPGDPARGAQSFARHCAGCHMIGGQGAKIGPELDGIGNRGLERVLEDVLDPNRNVDQAFRATLVKTRDGRVLSGLVRREEGEVLILQESAEKESRIPLREIEQRALSSLSPMPSNFGETISEPEFYDLVAFLLSRRTGR